MASPENGDGWGEWRIYVIRSLESNDKDHKEIMDCLSDIKKEVAALKVKAGMWGAVAGVLAGAVPILITLLIR